MRDFAGVYTRQVTPFKEGLLDLDTLQTLLARQHEAGIAGIVLLGAAGEADALSPEERQQLVDLPTPFQLLIDLGHNSTSILDLSQSTAVALIVHPSQHNQRAAYTELEALSDAAGPPLIVDNSQAKLHPLTVRELAQLPNIAGVIGPGDAEQLAATIYHAPPNFHLFAQDTTLLPALALGATSVISLAANALPSLIYNLYRATLEQDYNRARPLFFKLFPVLKGLHIEKIPLAIKHSMELLEHPAGGCRPPLTTLTPSHCEILEQLLIDAELLQLKSKA